MSKTAGACGISRGMSRGRATGLAVFAGLTRGDGATAVIMGCTAGIGATATGGMAGAGGMTGTCMTGTCMSVGSAESARSITCRTTALGRGDVSRAASASICGQDGGAVMSVWVSAGTTAAGIADGIAATGSGSPSAMRNVTPLPSISTSTRRATSRSAIRASISASGMGGSAPKYRSSAARSRKYSAMAFIVPNESSNPSSVQEKVP